MKNLTNNSQKKLISKRKIKAKIKKLALEIDRDYAGKTPIMVCLLKGSIFFFCDLIRNLKTPIIIDFIRLSSYGKNTVSSGDVSVLTGLSFDVCGRDVVLVEDIIDSGYTLNRAIEEIKKQNPKSIKICTLLDKPSRRQIQIEVDYVGFAIEDVFIVGYGLDYDEKFRNLDFILEFEKMDLDD